MRLVIGGTGQGKRDYVMKTMSGTGSPAIFPDLHLFIRTCMEEGRDPEPEILEFIEKNPDGIIICAEVGNGIVPLDPFEREYRERCGRILIRLAKEAEEVERVICGIGQRIK